MGGVLVINCTVFYAFFLHLLHCFCALIRNSKLREQAVEVLRDLLAGHDSDTRYTAPECRSRISSIYLPLLSVVMDNYHRLYKVGVAWVWLHFDFFLPYLGSRRLGEPDKHV